MRPKGRSSSLSNLSTCAHRCCLLWIITIQRQRITLVKPAISSHLTANCVGGSIGLHQHASRPCPRNAWIVLMHPDFKLNLHTFRALGL